MSFLTDSGLLRQRAACCHIGGGPGGL